MCVTVGTALAIGGIAASAATTTIAAKKGANAAESAAARQERSAQEALRLQQERYQQSRQDFNPYQQAGAGALGRLGQRAAAAPPQFTPGQPFQMPQTAGSAAQPGAIGALGMGQGGPMGQMAPQGSAAGPVGSQGGQPVTLRAPDGSTRQFPADEAQRIMAAAQAKGDTLQVVQ